MLDYRDISLMESVPLMWGPVTASPVGIEPMTPPPNNWYPIHNGENSTFDPGWPPNTPYACAEARRTQVADATFRDFCVFLSELLFCPLIHKFSVEPFLCIYIALASTSILRFEHPSCKINPNANMGFKWPQMEVPTKGFSKINRERSSMLKSTLVDGPL